MTLFVLLAGGLLVAVLVALLFPLVRQKTGAAIGMNAVTIEAYRDQLDELQAQLADDGADASRLEEERRALKLRLAAETRDAETQAASTPAMRNMAIGLVVAVPVLAAFAYAWIGNPGAINPPPAAKPGEHRLTRQDVEQMVERLTLRLKDAPGDVDSWILLARSQTSLGNFEQAARAYDAAVGYAPNNAGILADYADVVAMRQAKSFAGEPDQLIARALAADPQHTKSLALAGSSAFARKDFSAARDFWNRAVATLPPDSPPARSLRSSIAQADAALSGGAGPATATGAARISGRVEIEPALAARVQPGDTLFVFARALDGPRVPLAVARMAAAKLPADFVLDDSMSMNPQLRLSTVRQVQIEAKISKSGSANPASGDLHGTIGPVAVGASGVRIQIREERR